MDLQAEKLELIKQLLEVNDPDVLSEIKAVLKRNSTDFYHYLPDAVKRSIEAGLRDIENGNFHSHRHVPHELETNYSVQEHH
jgi:predicted transcriptional regulator